MLKSFFKQMIILVLQQDKMKNCNKTSNTYLCCYSVLQPHFNKYFKYPNVNHKVRYFVLIFYTTCEIPEK